jgi:putative ABC transport system ATP-binding protein
VGFARRRPGGRRLGVSVAAGGAALSADLVYSLREVEKIYDAGGTRFELKVPRLDIARGMKLALIGESGSGKSTLLEMLAMILMPTQAGSFRFTPSRDAQSDDLDAIWRARDSDRLSELRSRYIGYVLQYGGLLPYLTVRKNIELPRLLLDLPVDSAAERLATELGIAAQLDKLPSALSVGQRQRAAIARALAHEPPIVIADEPTAAIDPVNSRHIMALFVDLVEALGVTVILATHAHELVRERGFTLLPHEISASDGQSMTVVLRDG